MRKTSPASTAPQQQQFNGGANQELLRLRKELVQLKSNNANLQEELDEKSNLYLEAVKQRDQYKERLFNAKDNINRVQDIVEQKVKDALGQKMEEHANLIAENKQLKEKSSANESQYNSLLNEKNQLLTKVHSQAADLRFFQTNVDTRDAMVRIDALRQEKEAASQKVDQLIKDINGLSINVENFMVENRMLRKMAGVPDNYGIDLEKIKLHDREKINDYKKLIKVLQDDNYKLEEERATLKHKIKMQSMMYNQNFSQDYKTRYNRDSELMTPEQLHNLDEYALKLLSGETKINLAPSDYQALVKENIELKNKLDQFNEQGFKMIQNQVQALFKDKKLGDNSDQLSRLIKDNEELRIMIARLFEEGVRTNNQGGTPSNHNYYPQSFTNGSGGGPNKPIYRSDPRYRAPEPTLALDGEYQSGVSYKFGNSHLNVIDKDGHPGVSSSTAYEHAFLQLQLQETLELIKRKDENLKTQQIEIDSLYNRVRDYILTQDELYKDFIKMERAFTKKEAELKQQVKTADQQLMEEKKRVQNLENAVKSMGAGPDGNRIVELTKQNSILDVNLLKLTRKYQSLEEQEKLLRREYHNKDNDMAEKDRQVQWRINSLKEWKARAIQQLDLQFRKLRIAVPISEYEIAVKEADLDKQLKNDYIMKNNTLLSEKAELIRKQRDYDNAEENLRQLNEDKSELEEELNIVKKRLEALDPVFRFENSVFAKIAQVLKRARISPQQAFEQFDKQGDGTLQRSEFQTALEMMNVHNLQKNEIEIVWDSLDVDKSGTIDLKEFSRKLERYGVRNVSKEETIIIQMIQAVQRSPNVRSLSKLFEIIDKQGRGYISRQDFADIFYNLNLKIDQAELDRFLDHWWKDKEAGIDYKGFHRIFNKYQVRMNREEEVKKAPKISSDETIRLKKKLFTELDIAFRQTGRSISELFKKVDTDGSHEIGADEFFKMFQQMKFRLNEIQSKAIFDSIDYDGSGSIELPELTTAFREVCSKTEEELIQEEHAKQKENMLVTQYGGISDNLSSEQMTKIQAQTRLDLLLAQNKQYQRKLDTQLKIYSNAQNSLVFLQSQYDQLEKKYGEMQVNNYEMKERVIKMETDMRSCIRRDEADNLQVENEKLKVELVETRAAMLSYKNMYNVIGDQAKNLKLIQERKKDENDNLMNALREMQSEGVNQERLGKLYFIIMLSRWQEASVNKKYDNVLMEVKDLRSELINTEQMCQANQLYHHEAESMLQQKNLELEQIKIRVSAHNDTSSLEKNVQLLNKRLQDIVENLTESELELLKQRNKYRDAQNQLDSMQAQSEHEQVIRKLQFTNPDEMANKVIELSEKHSKMRLNELRANRKCEELEEKCRYYQNLIKNNNDTIMVLEEKSSKSEAEIIKIQQAFDKRYNEALKQYFASNKFAPVDDYEVGQGGNGFQRRPDPSSFQGRLNRASSMTGNLRKNGGFTDQDVANSHMSNAANDATASYTKPVIFDDQATQIRKLKQEIENMRMERDQKNTQIARYEQWQNGDKYLNQEEHLRDAIEDARMKTQSQSQKEHREMQDAAYQTIKTLQDMIDTKNEVIRGKEDQIAKMRAQMNAQREFDAQTISELREQISLTGQNTLAKMQEIVSKHTITSDIVSQKIATNATKNQQLDVKEFNRILQEKDHAIQQLKQMVNSHGAENQNVARKRDERNEQIENLQNQLRIERLKNDNDATKQNKGKIDSLTKKCLEQDNIIKKLQSAIDIFKDRMTKYESERLQLTDANEVVNKKEMYEVQILKKEIETLKNKIQIVEQNRDKKNDDIKALKVRTAELDAQDIKLKSDLAEVKKQAQNAEKALEDERREKVKLQIRLNNIENDMKIGGNVGGKMTYENLLTRITELEADNRILECQKKTVVVYNKEVGSFEYIGEPRPLNPHAQVENVRDLIANIQNWLSQQNRLTVGPIFRSLDKNNYGDLDDEQMKIGLEKIGIVLKPTEMNLLKQNLVPEGGKRMKIEPFIRELQRIPMVDFIIKPIRKLAYLIEARDILRDQFRLFIDKDNQENLSIEQTQRAISALNKDDFNISNDEVESIFKQVGNVTRIVPGTQMQVSKFIDQVYYALKAVVIWRMKEGLERSGKYLVDLLIKHDANKDGLLSYLEVENLLLDIGVTFKQSIYNEIVIAQILDVGKKQTKVSYDIMKWYLGGGNVIQRQSLALTKADMVPSQDLNVKRGKLSKDQYEICRGACRKILTSGANLFELLGSRDLEKEGFISTEDLVQTIQEKRITDLQPGELDLLVAFCDRSERGFLVIPNFISTVNELAQETIQEVKLRAFAGAVSRSTHNLRAELNQFVTHQPDRLSKDQFRKAIKQMALGLGDPEIDLLFSCGEVEYDSLDIKEFIKMVTAAGKTKPPNLPKNAVKPESKIQATQNSKIGQGTTQNTAAFDSWEIEKKYKKNLEALKQEIEDRNREIKIARKEVQDANSRCQIIEREKIALENNLVNKASKPPRETGNESSQQNTLMEMQKLKDENYHLQTVNQVLLKTINVELKTELGKKNYELDVLEKKLKVATDKVRTKTNDLNSLVSKPMDQLARREEREELRQKALDELNDDYTSLQEEHKQTVEKLFKTEERLLDLKFEKETFDLQYARLQKRITDLENYKLQSSQLQADLKNKLKEQIDKIKDDTEKLRGDSLNKIAGDTVKLKPKKNRTAQELEQIVEQLKRVVEKQKVEIENLTKNNENLKSQNQRGSDEPALKQKVEMLENIVKGYETAEVKEFEKDVTIKKLIFANKTLRTDYQQEIDRFNLLQEKYSQLLIKYKIATNQNTTNEKLLFKMTTGAQIENYEPFLEDRPKHRSKKKSYDTQDPGELQEDYGGNDSCDSLNDYLKQKK